MPTAYDRGSPPKMEPAVPVATTVPPKPKPRTERVPEIPKKTPKMARLARRPPEPMIDVPEISHLPVKTAPRATSSSGAPGGGLRATSRPSEAVEYPFISTQKASECLPAKLSAASEPAPAPRSYTPEEQAEFLRRFFVPVNMKLAVEFDQQITPTGFVAYMDQFLRDSGSPTDPVEIALLEQLALCRLRAANLHAKATTAGAIEATEAYSGMSIRVGTELRKLAATLEAYRASKAARKAK